MEASRSTDKTKVAIYAIQAALEGRSEDTINKLLAEARHRQGPRQRRHPEIPIMKGLNEMIVKEQLHPGFTKYHLNKDGVQGWAVYPVIHHFTSPDIGSPHDHPFEIDVHILSGSYVEEVYEILNEFSWSMTLVTRKHGDRFVIPAGRIHRIISLPDGECWTCCQYGSNEQEPRFWRCENGMIQSRVWNSRQWNNLREPSDDQNVL